MSFPPSLCFCPIHPSLHLSLLPSSFHSSLLLPVISSIHSSTPLHSFMPIISLPYSYETSRAHVDAVFGLQFNTSFPNVLRPCDSECGCGGFPSTSNGRYNEGLDLLVSATTEVCAAVDTYVVLCLHQHMPSVCTLYTTVHLSIINFSTDP